jgi:hypothetical protein
MSTEGLASWAIGLGVKHAVRVGRVTHIARPIAAKSAARTAPRLPLAEMAQRVITLASRFYVPHTLLCGRQTRGQLVGWLLRRRR